MKAYLNNWTLLILMIVLPIFLTLLFVFGASSDEPPAAVPVTDESPFCQHTNLETGEIDFPCRDDR